MWSETPRHMGEVCPKHQKVIAMLYINREIIKYLGERGEGNQTDPYSQDFLDAVNIFSLIKGYVQCTKYPIRGIQVLGRVRALLE
jgi:hypothetical protein